MRCAIVEPNICHGEILPTLVSILNQLDIDVDVYASPTIIRNDPFFYTKDLQFRLTSTESFSYKFRAKVQKFRKYDFVILNSLEPKEVLNQFQTLSVPIIALMHNGKLIQSDPDYRTFFDQRQRKPVLLVKQQQSSNWIVPVYLGELPAKQSDSSDLKQFCVQGNVEFFRRNYDSILEAVSNLVASGIQKFQVSIVGRNNTPDGATFRKKVNDCGLGQYFQFSDGELAYKDFYEWAGHSDFMLPLIDTTSEAYASYFADKMTTSLQIAIAFGVVPIAHSKLASVFEIKDGAILYEDCGLADAMKTAMNTETNRLASFRKALDTKRSLLLKQSDENLRSVLNQLQLSRSL